MKKLTLLFLVVISITQTFGQVRDYELGAQLLDQSRRSAFGGYFDYSDPEAINIKISVWGYVQYPGRYVVPDYATLIDLMSFAGGPIDDANLDEVRIYRLNEDNEELMISVDE